MTLKMTESFRPEADTLVLGLGASRRRLFQQFCTESLLLTGAGAVLGVLCCGFSLSLLRAWNPGNLPRVNEIQIDSTVLLFSLAVAILSSLVFGTVPAVQLIGKRAIGGLRTSNRVSGNRGTSNLRSALVISQLALAIVLVSGSVLFLRSFWNLQQQDLGFDTSRVLTFDLALPSSNYPDAARVSSFFRSLRSRVTALPGVANAGAVTGLPLTGRGGDWNFYYEGRETPRDATSPKGDWQVVTPGYFETMQVPLLQGRTFQAGDDQEAPLVVVINQSLAEAYFSGEDPIGQRIRMGGNDNNPFISIVGIVSDMRYRSVSAIPRPQIYLPLDQSGTSMGISPRRSLALAVRTTTLEPQSLANTVRQIVGDLDPQLPVSSMQTMNAIRSQSLGTSQFSAGLLTSFALLALILGATGIYGVVSYLVAERSREMGIRLALGAKPAEIVSMILKHGLRLTIYSLPLGLGITIASGNLARNLLYEVSAFDGALFGIVAGSLLLVALLACYLPARQASKLDPATVLQAD